MTGRIQRLADGDETGAILSEGGLNVSFDHTALLAYDLDRLAIGQLVTFDVNNAAPPLAVNIVVLKSPPFSHAGEPRLDPDSLRYTGFEQDGTARVFRFEQKVPGEDKRLLLITAEMSLFTKHHVGLQEGPALCLRLLTTDSRVSAQYTPQSKYSLGDREMLAHTACRPATRKKTPPKRNPRQPAW